MGPKLVENGTSNSDARVARERTLIAAPPANYGVDQSQGARTQEIVLGDTGGESPPESSRNNFNERRIFFDQLFIRSSKGSAFPVRCHRTLLQWVIVLLTHLP